MSHYNLNLEELKGPWFGTASHGHNIQPIFSMIVKLCVINTFHKLSCFLLIDAEFTRNNFGFWDFEDLGLWSFQLDAE